MGKSMIITYDDRPRWFVLKRKRHNARVPLMEGIALEEAQQIALLFMEMIKCDLVAFQIVDEPE